MFVRWGALESRSVALILAEAPWGCAGWKDVMHAELQLGQLQPQLGQEERVEPAWLQGPPAPCRGRTRAHIQGIWPRGCGGYIRSCTALFALLQDDKGAVKHAPRGMNAAQHTTSPPAQNMLLE